MNVDDAEVVELGEESEADELSLADEVISSDDTQERYWQLAEDVVVAEKEIAKMVPVQKGGNRDIFVSETANDVTLSVWKILADNDQKGFYWRDGLLFLTMSDPTFQPSDVLVLPQSFRLQVMTKALDTLAGGRFYS